MELEDCSNRTLLESIKRSRCQVWLKLRNGTPIETKKYKFEKSLFNLQVTICEIVTVLETGQKYLLTQHFSLGVKVWNLYRVIE